MGKNQHVVKHENGWAVKAENAAKPSFVYPTQQEAVIKATEIAKHQRSETKIHGRDGKIRAATSYGNSAPPPKKRK